MTYRLSLMALSIVAFSAANAVPAKVGPDNKAMSAEKAFHECVFDQAIALDDGRSDAETIVNGAFGGCLAQQSAMNVETDAYLSAADSKESPAQRNHDIEQVEAIYTKALHDGALNVILQHRSRLRAGGK